jgi:hypothetical protein
MSDNERFDAPSAIVWDLSSCGKTIPLRNVDALDLEVAGSKWGDSPRIDDGR